jgi:DNA-binding IclR family transcriptional regulator
MTTTAGVPAETTPRRRPAADRGDLRGGLRLVPETPDAAPRTFRGSRTDGNGRDGGVKSVTAALDVLDCFIDSDELGVSDIARRLGVAKSTAHRLLTSLCARGLADKNPETGQYRLGLHLFELGQLAGQRMRLRRTAMPLLEELRQRSGSTVHLAVASGNDVLYLERLETLRGMQLFGGIGRRLPSHCTSSGKVIAAYDSDFARARRAAGFPALTEVSIRNARDYDRALVDIRRRGVATNQGEASVGLASVAAPVLDSSGRAQAAISLVGPAAEFVSDFGRPARLVTLAARRLARSLGI